jgi:transcription-repair coupling factor (superfamily II helicase)
MNLEVLLQTYANDPRCFKIADGITLSKPKQIHLSGLHGSAAPFIVTSIYNNPACSQLNHIIILRDAEEAAYFHNTLENLTSALNLFYFPSSKQQPCNAAYRSINQTGWWR